MNTRLRPLACLLALAFALPAAAAPGPVTLQTFTTGLTQPVDITHAGDGSGRLFVVEQAGRIRIVKNGVLAATPFLDISGPVVDGGEQGLLSVAFHPQYAQNGWFYVYYTKAPTGSGGNDIVIARYARSAANPDLANPQSAQVLLTFQHPTNTNHNGGRLAFGPDGYLYAGIGDGGGGGDPFNAGQNLADLRAKILRLDVNGGSPYAIPAANPFVGTPGARGEIFAYGVRNPWRLSFDRATGDLFIGDVGQDAWEEIDFVPAGSNGGQNFGWRIYEGTHCYNPATNCSLASHVPPILEYPHDGATGGFSVTGGHRYRGHAVQELYGYYVYGDYVSGRVWAAAPGAGGAWATTVLTSIPNVSTFGEDEAGELYAANRVAGTVLRFRPVDTDGDGMSDAWETQHFGSATAGNPAADDDGDGLANAVEYAERRDPHVKDNDVFGDARLFAMQQYRDFLGREGDETGIAAWARAVSTGAWSRDQVIDAFLASPEFEGWTAPVVRLYFATFLRVPDYAGLVANVAALRAGTPLSGLADFFAASPEFAATYGSLDDTQFVTLLYQNVLGRAPDAAGLAGWTALLGSGTSRGQVLLGFSESPEFRAAMANEVATTLMYTGLLRRSPEPAGSAGWLAALDGGTPRTTVIDGFFLSAEYRSRFLP